MASLFDYAKQTRRFLHDAKQELIDEYDLYEYINRARREVAMRSQCIRRLPPVSGSIMSWSITSPGAGYTNPTAVVTPPDFPSGTGPNPNGAQATAVATQIGGQIVNVASAYGGDGYFQPQCTITDPTGSGAGVTPVLSPINLLNIGQETYNFSDVNLSMFPGVASILAVLSVSVIYANLRYSLPKYSFSVYQAMIRQYPAGQYQWVPTFCSQFGQGVGGSLYVYPLPSQPVQQEWDCICLPSDLTTDRDYEAIPDPWCDAVPYFSAYLGFAELQNWNAARAYQDQFDTFMHRYRAAASPGRAVNPYGRY